MRLTVKKVAELTGISVRTLHYYHKEGILIPKEVTETGYRLYDEKNLEQLQQILFLREVDFSIKEIKRILYSSDYNPAEVLRKQRELLLLKRIRLDNLIKLLEKNLKGNRMMSFKEFDMEKIDAVKNKYAAEVNERWGGTKAYKESQSKTKNYSSSDWEKINCEAEGIYHEFILNKSLPPEAPEVQELVEKWKNYISKNFYACNNEILKGLGEMYVADERFTKNIDQHCEGLAQFMSDAIRIYTR
ncbi:MAG: MerR family transcriptional regulator [Eubacteriaceae bacterium]